MMSKTKLYTRLVVAIIIVTLVLSAAHYIVFVAAATLVGLESPVFYRWLQIAFLLPTIGFVGTLVIGEFRSNRLIRVAYTAFAVWMGFFVYFFLSALVYGLAIGSAQMLGINSRLGLLGLTLGVVSIVLGVYGLIHARKLLVKQVELTLPNLPLSWRGRKAVLLSDIHLGHILGSSFLNKIVGEVLKLNPDLVLIAGDIFDGVKADNDELLVPLRNLRPRLGTYFVTGNHEEFDDSGQYLDPLRRVGVKTLMNESTDIEGVRLIGLIDSDSIDSKKFGQILSDMRIDRTKVNILLKHQPSQLEQAESAGISLQLSGHTHRAQQWPLNLLTFWIFRSYDYGLKRFGSMLVYTSSGLGTWGPPLRVGSDSEIVVLKFS